MEKLALRMDVILKSDQQRKRKAPPSPTSLCSTSKQDLSPCLSNLASEPQPSKTERKYMDYIYTQTNTKAMLSPK